MGYRENMFVIGSVSVDRTVKLASCDVCCTYAIPNTRIDSLLQRGLVSLLTHHCSARTKGLHIPTHLVHSGAIAGSWQALPMWIATSMQELYNPSRKVCMLVLCTAMIVHSLQLDASCQAMTAGSSMIAELDHLSTRKIRSLSPSEYIVMSLHSRNW